MFNGKLGFVDLNSHFVGKIPAFVPRRSGQVQFIVVFIWYPCPSSEPRPPRTWYSTRLHFRAWWVNLSCSRNALFYFGAADCGQIHRFPRWVLPQCRTRTRLRTSHWVCSLRDVPKEGSARHAVKENTKCENKEVVVAHTTCMTEAPLPSESQWDACRAYSWHGPRHSQRLLTRHAMPQDATSERYEKEKPTWSEYCLFSQVRLEFLRTQRDRASCIVFVLRRVVERANLLSIKDDTRGWRIVLSLLRYCIDMSIRRSLANTAAHGNHFLFRGLLIVFAAATTTYGSRLL